MVFRHGPMIEWKSWRLASDLVSRHPTRMRLIRGFPMGGQYDVLWINETPKGAGEIVLNRRGTIQVHGRFDGADLPEWPMFTWDEQLTDDPLHLVRRVESAAGLDAPSQNPSVTAQALVYRVLAAIAAAGCAGDMAVDIQEGFIDTSGFGGGDNGALALFSVPSDLLCVRDDDLYGNAGYRFWIVDVDTRPVIAVEQTSGSAWIVGSDEQIDLMALFETSSGDVSSIADVLLARVQPRDDG